MEIKTSNKFFPAEIEITVGDDRQTKYLKVHLTNQSTRDMFIEIDLEQLKTFLNRS